MTRKSPPVRDSDLMYLAIKRLEAIAEKMMRLEYDEKLDEMMVEASEWFDWAAFNIARRNGEPELPESEDDVDPYERAAVIAETLMVGERHASWDVIAEAIRAWSRKSKREGSDE